MRAGARRLPAALAIVLALVVATGCASSGDGAADGSGGAADITTSGNDGFHGAVIQNPYDLPALAFTDTAGRPFVPAEDARHAVTLVFFGYTHCPDVCPTTMAGVAAALRGTPQPLRSQVRVVFVTTDPARDTGKVLAAWLRNFDPDLPRKFVGLTGTLAQVEAAQAAAKVPVATENGQTHSAEQLLYGTDDYARVAFVSGSRPDDLRHDLPLVAKGA